MATRFEYNNMKFEILEDKTNEVALIDASDCGTHVVVPSQVTFENKTYIVTDITGIDVTYTNYWRKDERYSWRTYPKTEFRNAFETKISKRLSVSTGWEPSKIESIVFPNSIKTINDWNFHYFFYLSSIVIPDGIVKICDNAFKDCLQLKKVTLGSTIEEIGKNSFSGCSKLSDVVLGSNLTEIGEGAFEHTNISSIVIPDNVKKIGKEAFQCCFNTKEIIIGEKVTEIGADAFYTHNVSFIVVKQDDIEYFKKYFYWIRVISANNRNEEKKETKSKIDKPESQPNIQQTKRDLQITRQELYQMRQEMLQRAQRLKGEKKEEEPLAQLVVEKSRQQSPDNLTNRQSTNKNEERPVIEKQEQSIEVSSKEPVVSQQKNRILAVTLAVFLGSFGVHKFYTGKIIVGIVYLVFCWTYIPFFLGIIDGIRYLLASDIEFNEKFCKNK